MNKIEDRFILQPGKQPGFLVCTDTEHGIVCVFESKKYNETQKVTLLDDADIANYMQIAKYLREMGEWIYKNHPEAAG